MSARQLDVLEGGIREAARRLGIGERTAYRAAERGELPAVRIGNVWIIPLRAWERFLEQRQLD